MSEHTDTTIRMTERIKTKVDNLKRSFDVSFVISEPKNNDAGNLEDLKYRLDYLVNRAKRKHFKLEYTLDSVPQKLKNYNCVSCRKRKTGTYFMVYADAKKRKNDRDSYNRGWKEPLAKVCSHECGDMMILRLA